MRRSSNDWAGFTLPEWFYSVDFHDIEQLQRSGRWEDAGERLADTARAVERAGAECIVLCTNTMHKVVAQIEAAVRIPLLHIADATAAEIKVAGVSSVGLLGTRFTMEQEFYKERLQRAHGLRVLVPGERDRDIVHRIIYDELCLGRVVDSSRNEYRRVMGELVRRGAQAIILGCTEITMLIGQDDAAVPVVDTTALHARAAAQMAIASAG